MLVVQTMRSGPPKRAFLCRRRSQKREKQLEDAARLVRTMGKIAVINARNGEHAQEVRSQSDEHELQRDPMKDRENRDHVNRYERDDVVPLFFRQSLARLNWQSRCCSNVIWRRVLLGLHSLTVSNRLQ
jgi:hypothetical protein